MSVGGKGGKRGGKERENKGKIIWVWCLVGKRKEESECWWKGGLWGGGVRGNKLSVIAAECWRRRETRVGKTGFGCGSLATRTKVVYDKTHQFLLSDV